MLFFTDLLNLSVVASVKNCKTKKNKKYVLRNAVICPIAEIVRNTTFDDDIKTQDR